MVSTDKEDIFWIEYVAGEWSINRKLITFERIKEFEEQLLKKGVLEIDNLPDAREFKHIDTISEFSKRQASEYVYEQLNLRAIDIL